MSDLPTQRTSAIYRKSVNQENDSMKKSAFIEQAEAEMPIKELCRKGGFSDSTFYNWWAKFGGMDVPDAKRLLDRAAIFHGYPLAVRIDNGPEFTSRAFMAHPDRAWQADAERLHRELQWQAQGRVPERALV